MVTVVKKQQRMETASPPVMVLAVKILLVLVILFMLPKLVDSANNRRRSKKTLAEYQTMMHTCSNTVCPRWFPEERMNCVAICVSPNCYQQIYAMSPLEDGEIDLQRLRQFEECARNEIKQAKLQRRRDFLAEAKQRQQQQQQQAGR